MSVDQNLNKNLGNLRRHAQTPLALAAEADNFAFARVDLQSPPNQEKVISVRYAGLRNALVAYKFPKTNLFL
jgi:hypothetical protein